MSYETRPQMEMSESERSIAELFRNLSRDIGTLLRQDSELARTKCVRRLARWRPRGPRFEAAESSASPAS